MQLVQIINPKRAGMITRFFIQPTSLITWSGARTPTIHMSSHIAEDVKYNIVVGRFHDFRRAILDRTRFVRSLSDAVLALVETEVCSHIQSNHHFTMYQGLSHKSALVTCIRHV